jgi:hypothetical protein
MRLRNAIRAGLKTWRIQMRNAHVTALFVLTVASIGAAKDPELSDPKATLTSYVEAVKAGDFETAKKCWVIDGKRKDEAMEVVVGYWTSNRRARVAVIEKFGNDGLRIFGKSDRTDLSDAALDLTLSRIKDSEVEIKDNRATLRIRWKEDDGYPDEAFMFGNRPLPFRKVGKIWHLDATEHGGAAESILQPGTWGPLFRDYAAMMNEIADGLAASKLKTREEVSQLLKERAEAAEKKYKEALEANPPARKD